jgi:hypothetical protein
MPSFVNFSPRQTLPVAQQSPFSRASSLALPRLGERRHAFTQFPEKISFTDASPFGPTDRFHSGLQSDLMT